MIDSGCFYNFQILTGGDGPACGGADCERDLQEPSDHEGRHHPRVQGSDHQGELWHDVTQHNHLQPLGEQAHDRQHGQVAHKQTEGEFLYLTKIQKFKFK